MSAAVRRRRPVWWKRALPRDPEARVLMRVRRLRVAYRYLFGRLWDLEAALPRGRVNAETLSALEGLEREFAVLHGLTQQLVAYANGGDGPTAGMERLTRECKTLADEAWLRRALAGLTSEGRTG